MTSSRILAGLESDISDVTGLQQSADGDQWFIRNLIRGSQSGFQGALEVLGGPRQNREFFNFTGVLFL